MGIGTPTPIQHAAISAWNDETHVEKLRNEYQIKRNKIKGLSIPLVARMTEEVHRSVETGMKLVEQGIKVKIEIHIDVSGPDASAATSKYSDMLTGYAKGAGFDAKVKPNSWASSAIADKHSK